MTRTHVGAVILAGNLVGLGVFLLIVQLLPAPPALGPALHRLHPLASSETPTPAPSWLRRRLSIPHTDLRLLGRTTDQYYLTVGLSALFGLAVPALAAAAVLLLQIPISPAIPAAGSLAAALAAAWLAHRDVLSKAAAARAEFVRAMCTYLDLTAHQIVAGHGPVQSLTRAASVCHGWVYARIREALLHAELQLTAPWQHLKILAHDIDVIELGDLADIMSSAGTEGADVHHTLRARAESLRDQIRAHALADAEVRTSKLDIPAAALLVIVLVLIGYPFIVRLTLQ